MYKVLFMSKNVNWQRLRSRECRAQDLEQHPAIAWLTGLSGAGKTSVANATDWMLANENRRCMVLDGDNLRHGLNSDLGFSPEERTENVRRAAEVARLMAESGLIAIVALISPTRADRALARRIAGDIPFLEVFIDADLSVCEARDVKGLYAKARSGHIKTFTGISAPYEAPSKPDLVICTRDRSITESARDLAAALLALSAVQI
ncbi:adenylyl-sulfate kinase [Methylobacterium sp. M6A4_1b]